MNFFDKMEEEAGLANKIIAAGNGKSLAVDTLIRKLEKHNDNPRRQALYIREFLEWGKEEFPKNLCLSKIKISRTGVGYLNRDGTYHWFLFK